MRWNHFTFSVHIVVNFRYIHALLCKEMFKNRGNIYFSHTVNSLRKCINIPHKENKEQCCLIPATLKQHNNIGANIIFTTPIFTCCYGGTSITIVLHTCLSTTQYQKFQLILVLKILKQQIMTCIFTDTYKS